MTRLAKRIPRPRYPRPVVTDPDRYSVGHPDWERGYTEGWRGAKAGISFNAIVTSQPHRTRKWRDGVLEGVRGHETRDPHRPPPLHN